jgi:hypothetical protein
MTPPKELIALADRLFGPRDTSVIRDDGGEIYACPTSRVSVSGGDTVLAADLRPRAARRLAKRLTTLEPTHDR